MGLFSTLLRFSASIGFAGIFVCSPASAWTVTHQRDPMTDKMFTWASARSGAATLLVGCLNGSVQPRLTFPARIGFGRPGASFRFDDGPVVPRIGMIGDDGTTLYIWHADYTDAMTHLRKGKRLRVQMGSAVFDFDLTAGEPMPAIGCR
jgi:hypothetical protein